MPTSPLNMDRVSSNLEDLESQKISGNLKVDPKRPGTVREVERKRESQGEVGDIKKISCRPSKYLAIIL